MKRTVAIILIVTGALLLAGSAMALTLNEESTTTRPNGDIERVVIDNENGDVTIRPGTQTSVRRSERWNFVRPRYGEDVEDGTLRIRTECASVLIFNNCGVELALVVPEDVEVATRTTNGDIEVAGLASDAISLGTTNGDVEVTGTEAEQVNVTSTNGDLTFTGLDAEAVRANTTNGDMHVAIDGRPDEITLTSTNGDVEVLLPSGDYDIRTATTNGDVSIADGLDDISDASRSIAVTTTNGDIELRST